MCVPYRYLPRSLFVLAFEIVFLIWTAAQICGEFAEVSSIFKEVHADAHRDTWKRGHAFYAVCGSYLSNLFNVLDWTRFALIALAVTLRVQIFQVKGASVHAYTRSMTREREE